MNRNKLIAIAMVLVVAVSLLASDSLLQSAAMVSAGIELPQGAAVLLQEAPDLPAYSSFVPRPPQPPRRPVPLGDFDITATPADIALLMEEAWYEFADQVPDGRIVPIHYTTQNAQVWGDLAVHNITATQRERDISQDLTHPLSLQLDPNLPSILVYHTHTTEGFELIDRPWYAQNWNSRTDNYNRNIVRVGVEIVDMLRRAGFNVIHDTTVFDVPFAGAYDRSRLAIQYWMARYPSIVLTIDVHRDAIHRANGDRIKPVADILGQRAAQVMFIAGTQEGNVGNFPNWETNLALATQLHVFTQQRYPGLMKPLLFTARRFNMDLAPYALFFEIGTDANTLQEAVFTGRLMGEALAAFLLEYIK